MTYPYQVKELNADNLTPISVFNRLKGEKKFILESSSHHADKGRYSFIGMNPFKEIIGKGKKVKIKTQDQFEILTGKPLEIVKDHLPNVDLELPYAFYGGAVGYVSYDAIREYVEIGQTLEDEIDMPDVHLMIYEDLLIFDHHNLTLTIIAIDMTKSRDLSELNTSIDQITEQLLKIEKQEDKEKPSLKFKTSIDQAEFMKKVEAVKRKIDHGDVSQVVLSQRMQATFDHDPFYFYRRLRLKNPSPYMYYINFGDYIVLGASPESLVKVKGNKIMTNPIAGTRHRGETEVIDKMLELELLNDPKELMEHEMLVELSKDDLKRIAREGSIQLLKSMKIERYQHVMHIVSELIGELKDNLSPIDALISLLPAGTVSGAPKQTAMAIINQLETKKRGVYAGAVGYINMNGDLDLALAIRTMVIKNKTAYVQAGAGIVKNSDPRLEYEETINKLKALLQITD